MLSAVEVRLAQATDAEHLLRLRSAVFRESDFMLWEPSEFKDSTEDEERRIARLNGHSNSRCFVAADRTDLVGFLNAMGSPVNRLRHSTTLALGVRQSHWGTGVGTALIQAALQWARDSRLRRVELTVHTDNERALKLYRRAGFQIEGVRRSSLLVGSRYKDEYLMSVLNEV